MTAKRQAFSRRELLAAGGTLAAASTLTPWAAWAGPATASPTAPSTTSSTASPTTPRAAPSASPAVPAVDPMSLVDPDLRAGLERFRKDEGGYAIDSGNLARIRKLSVGSPTPLPAPRYESRSIPAAAGSPPVRVIVINAAPGGRPRPAILHIHGGGFIAGTADEVVPKLQRTSQEHDCLIVTVDYRLAPETRFPGSLEDNYAALKWLHGAAGSLGADGSRIAIMGESAGGGHAAMLAIAARDRGEVPIMFQALIYPMLDDRTGSSRQVPPFIGKYVWVPASNRFGWSSLLGVPAGSRVVPAGAVPARAENLAGLPPAFIGVGAIDLFVDEDVDYARRLIDSGVLTELCVVPGAFHGFDVIVPEAPVSKSFRATWTAALTKAFDRTAKG